MPTVTKALELKVKGKEIVGIPEGEAVIFAAKIGNGKYCVVLAAKDVEKIVRNKKTRLSSLHGLDVYIGDGEQFTQVSAPDGCKFSGRWYLAGPDFYLGYFQKSNGSEPFDEYCFGIDSPSSIIPAENILVPLT
jgi:hypothetical protein